MSSSRFRMALRTVPEWSETNPESIDVATKLEGKARLTPNDGRLTAWRLFFGRQ